MEPPEKVGQTVQRMRTMMQELKVFLQMMTTRNYDPLIQQLKPFEEVKRIGVLVMEIVGQVVLKGLSPLELYLHVRTTLVSEGITT